IDIEGPVGKKILNAFAEGRKNQAQPKPAKRFHFPHPLKESPGNKQQAMKKIIRPETQDIEII
ncbi:MAG: hypothetical protein H3C64_05400, partial [Candidatus Kuenenia stuttgartiensis]|nr:hypothetical protein [Candidatus Kuenenia stuttgartiensis]